jgi:hypothetical protein
MPYVAKYRSADPERFLLGGWKSGQSSRFESKRDAMNRLQTVIDIHKGLDTPTEVSGEVVEVTGSIEIFDDGSAIGCRWGKARVALKSKT